MRPQRRRLWYRGPIKGRMDKLVVVGARQHNLRGVSVVLPRGKLVVLTGPSGSGKSSLAFDTIYAEGQRRYVESLSAYARQFLEQLAKPDVERIEGLSPAIAIEQKPLAKSPRSTVGTVTEIADYLRLLYARAGVPHCPKCGRRIEAQSASQIVDRVLEQPEGTRFSVLAPICRGRKGELKLELERLRREGFVRARIDGQNVDLGDDIALDRSKPHDLDVVIDRIVRKEGVRARIADSAELALKIGEGRLLIHVEGEDPFWLSERFACTECGISLPPIEPRIFSFNGPHGACPSCDGLGARTTVDPERVIGDTTRTLREGVVQTWGKRGSMALASNVADAVTRLGVDPDAAWKELAESDRRTILFGEEPRSARDVRRKNKGTKRYEGVIPRLEARLRDDGDREEAADTADIDDIDGTLGDGELARFLVTRTCSVCGGTRLRPESLAVRIAGQNIAELSHLSLLRLSAFVDEALTADSTVFRPQQREIAEPLLRGVRARLGFLTDVGLDYLSLDRSAQTLSSGEGQRIRLATQIGAALVGVLYVLDEPSVGLHARDNERLLVAEARLRDLGNTVLIVEHDREAILAADYVVDMGPGAGALGGYVVAEGSPAEIMANPKSVTGPWLTGERSLPMPKTRRAFPKERLIVERARAHNLKEITCEIPIGLFTCFTGVSGSGKSSLVIDTLLSAARSTLYAASAPIGECDAVRGLEHVDKVISIDQAPIGRTPRSNPATYTGVFSLLRELYATLPEARARGYKAGRFSFNVKGGRCEACQGDGVLRVEMHFLPDLFVKCETCRGSRYSAETLEVKYRGLSIADALALTVAEGEATFESIPKVAERLRALARVGLGYVKLGQPATTLSGGEAQRVKLARELARKATGRTLYVLDEPTTGLHFNDIEILLGALLDLRDQGNTVVVIEHNLDVVACADWVIDMGPEGGEGGGEIVVAGTPEHVAQEPRSHTARYLAPIVDAPNARKRSHTRGADK